MSDQYDKHPGKGFTPVGGYEPPAGTQAWDKRRQEEERLRQEKLSASWGTGGPKSSGGGSSCFPAGTQVLTPHGARAIEGLGKSDLVIAWNNRHRVLEPRAVLCNKRHGAGEVLLMTFDDSSQVTTTPIHSFWTGKGWEKARKIQVGQHLFFAGGAGLTKKRLVASEPSVCNLPLYNLIIEGHFNYCAGGALVHSFTYLRTVRMMVWAAAARSARLWQAGSHGEPRLSALG